MVFSTSSRSEHGIAAAIEEQLDADFGDSPAVIVRSVPELVRIGGASPYAKAGANPARHHVTFLASAPSKKALAALDLPPSGHDELVVDGREIYVYTPDGYAGTKYTGTFLERRLGRRQHHAQLEHRHQALRAGWSLSRAAGVAPPLGSPRDQRPGAARPVERRRECEAAHARTQSVRRRRADRAFYIRLAGAIRQNERALERLKR